MTKRTARPRKTGKLKMLAGPTELTALLDRAAPDCRVIARRRTLRWSRSGSPGGRVRGSAIQAVAQHGRSFTVHLAPSGYGVDVLTFQARTVGQATKWVTAINDLVAADIASAPQTDSGPPGRSTGTPVALSYKTNTGATIDEDVALLVIACDPRNLIGVCDYSPEDLEIFGELANFTFHTTLMEVDAAAAPKQAHGVIFAPQPLDQMDGSVYGFRNETAKQFGLDAANKMATNLVTVYQLQGVTETPWKKPQFLAALTKQLKTLEWWPFGTNYTIKTSVTTPYFNHFDLDELRAGRPWDLLNAQGQRNTLLVHATTCFESALHCWAYAGMMLETVPSAQAALPADLGAPIAILGAGVSGLLFATRLTGLGYTNLRILESTARYGGKTHTVVESTPHPDGDQQDTVCELGTCYLSPAYKPMVDDLKRFLQGNTQIDFTQSDPAFRGIATEGELPPEFNAPPLLAYAEYVILKATAEMGHSNSTLHRYEAMAKMAVDLAKYGLLHAEYVGLNPPMPSKKPGALKGDFGHQTFYEFLSSHGLDSMVGMLQYGYEVQGYGPLHTIPAYYGLLWMTPAITWTILADQLKLEDTPIVTAWTEGWGDVWKQIVDAQSLNIVYSAKVESIVRS